MFATVDRTYTGIDWVTATSSITGNRVASVALIAETSEYLLETLFPGEARKTIRNHNGGRQWEVGTLRYKSNEHGNMLSVSGGRAAEAWIVLSTLVNNVHFSRLDLNIDCALQTPAPHVLRKLYELCNDVDGEDDRRKPPVLISNDLGDTLYLGSRHSPLFLRIYDKSVSYNLPLGNVYRFETENKQHRGDRIAAEMAKNAYNLADWITGQVARDFGSRGVKLPAKFARVDGLPMLEATITTDEATLRWYRRQVAPSVKKLLSGGVVARETIQAAMGFGGPELVDTSI